MKKFLLSLALLTVPFFVFAEAEVTAADFLTVLKAIGCFILVLLIPGIIIGLVCSGIRTIRGFLDI